MDKAETYIPLLELPSSELFVEIYKNYKEDTPLLIYKNIEDNIELEKYLKAGDAEPFKNTVHFSGNFFSYLPVLIANCRFLVT